MARLTKLEKYAICWLGHKGYSNEQIVEELKLTAPQVKRTLEKNTETKDSESNDPITTTQSSTGHMNPKEAMIRHTSEKQNNTVAIMTKAASEICDETSKTVRLRTETQKGIFRPNDK